MADAPIIRRVVVTGASGFLGRHVAQLCLDRGIAVLAPIRDRAAEIPAGAEIMSLSDPEWPGQVTRFAPDAVFHVAAWSGLAHRAEDIDPIIEANIRFGAHLLEAAASCAKPPAFVRAGSFAQYAAGGDAYAPNSFYAASKEAFSAIADYYDRMRAVPCLGLTLHDIYGESDTRGRLLNLIARALDDRSGGIDLTDGTQHISFVHIDDAARAFLVAAEYLHIAGVSGNPDYAVAGDDRRPLRQQIEDLLQPGDDAKLLRWGARPQPSSFTPILPDLPRLPGWQPAIALSKGFAVVRAHV